MKRGKSFLSRNNFISLVVLSVSFAGAGYYLFCHPDLVVSFEKLSLFSVVSLCLLQVALLLVNGLFLKISAEKFSLQIPFTEWFGLAVVTVMGNYLTPFSGGMLIRATYMKCRYDFQFAKFAALLGANYLVNFWVISLIGILITALSWSTSSVKLIFVFFLGVWGGITLLALLPVAKLSGSRWFLQTLNVMLEGWALMKRDLGLLLQMAFLATANIVLNAFSFWFAYQALGFSISFFAATIISLMAVFSAVIKVTPANLGIYEAMVSFTAPLVGLTVGEGLVTALLLRGATVVPVFILGPCFSFIFTRQMIGVGQVTTIPPEEDGR